MGRVVVISKWFNTEDHIGLPTGEMELLVDSAYDEDTLEAVVLPLESPHRLGCWFNERIGEYMLGGRS